MTVVKWINQQILELKIILTIENIKKKNTTHTDIQGVNSIIRFFKNFKPMIQPSIESSHNMT